MLSVSHLFKHPQFLGASDTPFPEQKWKQRGKGREGKTIRNTHFFLHFLREGLTKPEYWNSPAFLFIYNRSTLPHQSVENMGPKEQDFCPGRQHFDHIFELQIFLKVQNSSSIYIVRFQNEILHFPFLEWHWLQRKFNNLKKISNRNWNTATQTPWILLVGRREGLTEDTLLFCWLFFFLPSLSANAIRNIFLKFPRHFTIGKKEKHSQINHRPADTIAE